MLSYSSEVAYIHEPLNPDNFRSGRCSVCFEHFFTYICSENETEYKTALQHLLNYQYQWASELPYIRSLRDIGRAVRDSSKYLLFSVRRARPLVKDPIAVFSAEWLAKTFEMDVVVLIRHPAAFAWSFKKKGQEFKFSELLNQPLLMQEFLEPFREEMEQLRNGAGDRIEEAILLWRMIYTVILHYQSSYPEWIFLRHEDLSLDPLAEFEHLYDQLGLQYTSSVQSSIKKYIVPSTKQRVVGGNNISMDSQANIKAWAKQLNRNEIERIRKGTMDISSHYYDDRDWEI